ncbi:MAG: STAS domain-containing protein [Sphingobium sp.]|nr:STAS domain-containing protein [Sphingobium sp.]
MSAIVLPATMDKGALPELARQMTQLCDKGEPLLIDGSKVSRVGLAGLQLLVSGALAANESALEFKVTNASEELAGAATLSGLSAMLGIAA